MQLRNTQIEVKHFYYNFDNLVNSTKNRPTQTFTYGDRTV